MRLSLSGILTVAYKEFLHILRDRRILVLVIALPPLLTLMFGHAFEDTAISHIPTSLEDRDGSEQSKKFVDFISKNQSFDFKARPTNAPLQPNLLVEKVDGSLIIPKGWGDGLVNIHAIALQLYVDGSDTTTGEQISGALQAALGEFQQGDDFRAIVLDALPIEVFDLAKQLPVEVQKDVQQKFDAATKPLPLETAVLYNPNQRFIDFVIPGIIGLILQLLTVTLMACTIARERESGTLYQLIVTSLRRSEIVIGKVLPYLALSLFLIATTIAVAYWHFGTQFQQPLLLSLICFLFLLCSLGLGLLISAFCNTQTQAIQFAVFYLLPVFPLSGAFAPLDNLPGPIRAISQTFPLTHFCHAFRLVNMHQAGLSFVMGDLLFLAAGAFITCAGAGFLLQRIQE